MASIETLSPLSMPTAAQIVTMPDGTPSQVWWRFWFGLFTRSAATISYLVGTAIAATGTTQTDAFALQSEWNEITSTPANSGVRLNGFGLGFSSTVFNVGGNTLRIYPPIGGTIDTLGVNNPYLLANNKSQTFYQLTGTSFRSTQLG